MRAKRYLYKGKLYSDHEADKKLDNYEGYVYELLCELEQAGEVTTNTVTIYGVDGEIIGTDDEIGEEDVIDYLIDCGVEDLEEC